MDDSGLVDIVEATWIKNKNPRAKTLLLTFQAKTPPEYISIAREQSMTKVRQ